MALSLLLLGRNPHLSRTRIVGSLLLGFFLLSIPLGEWNGFSWIRLLEPNPSFTLTGLLGIALWGRLSGKKIFRGVDWSAAWLVGAASALALYATGLGLTPIDSYAWGWGARLPVTAALIAAILILCGNRFGILLMLPFAGFLLQLQESTNFWDAVMDPFYGGVSLILVLGVIVRAIVKTAKAGKSA